MTDLFQGPVAHALGAGRQGRQFPGAGAEGPVRLMRRLADPTLLVATHNAGKLEEIADLMGDFGISAVGAAQMGLVEPDETGATFVENARIKAHTAAKATGLPALADDSGIEIDALHGAPGVHTADWAETPNGRDFVLAMTRVHDELVSSGAVKPWNFESIGEKKFRATQVMKCASQRHLFFGSSVERPPIIPCDKFGTAQCSHFDH